MASIPLTTKISQSSSKQISFKIKGASLGDGYVQRAHDGLNYKRDTWTIYWKHLNASDTATVINALDAAGGVAALTWTPFNELVQKKFILVDGYTITEYNGLLSSISAKFQQVFDL